MSSTKKSEVILAVLAYSFCSGSLVLVNKLILHYLPYPSLVIAVQLLATLAFILGATTFGIIDVDPLMWDCVVPYLAYTVAFSLGVFCNMKSLTLSNVETIIVFRALAPFLVSILDALFLGRQWPSARSWGGLSLIVLGALGYALTDEQFQSQGMNAYFWPTLYLFVISFEMAYGKNIIKSVPLKTRTGPVFYTNLLGFPPMIMFAAMGKEFQHSYEDMWAHDEYRFPPMGLALLGLGCVVGTAIGYSSWWCRGQVSAASFTLIGVMNKCVTVLVNLCIWDQHAAPAGIASLSLCLLGGVIYQQAPMQDFVKQSDIVVADSKDDDFQDNTAASEELTPLKKRNGDFV
eukprot:scaffold13826_cov50-Attheya_sp.AAC.1